MGVFPDVTLAEAREDREDAKRKLRDRIDPMAERQATKLHEKHAAANSFKAVAEEWMESNGPAGHAGRVKASMVNDLFSDIGRSLSSTLPRCSQCRGK